MLAAIIIKPATSTSFVGHERNKEYDHNHQFWYLDTIIAPMLG